MSNKKLNLKDKYRLLTRDLEWEYSYRDYKEIFPQEEYEGIKITDWSKWEDPFRLTMDAYWKYQAEKEKKLYAIFDAFAQAEECQCPCPCPEAQAEEPDDIPEEIIIKKLVEIYDPVSFTHQDHADLADEGCTQCHHHAPPGEYKACDSCHKRTLFQEKDKLNLPGLKGAYHRQCVGCHVDWDSGPIGCTECHEIRK